MDFLSLLTSYICKNVKSAFVKRKTRVIQTVNRYKNHGNHSFRNSVNRFSNSETL